MKKKIDNIFVRFGKLHLTKQDGFKSDTFHSAPTTMGFYAFPFRFQEMFLIGSITDFQPDIINLPKKLKYEEIQKIEDSEIRIELYRERDNYINKKISELRHEFYVDDTKEIWHHLNNVSRNEIISESKDWIKTTIGTYKKCLIKQTVIDRAKSLSSGYNGFNKIRSGKTGYYSKDHYEVFFDTKVY